jgi:hypothetical protein
MMMKGNSDQPGLVASSKSMCFLSKILLVKISAEGVMPRPGAACVREFARPYFAPNVKLTPPKYLKLFRPAE